MRMVCGRAKFRFDFLAQIALNPSMRSLFLISMSGLISCSLLTAYAEDPAAGKQVEQELKTSDGTIPYLLYLPTNYGAATSEPVASKRPLVLFLHGRGESEGPLSIVKKWGPPNFIDHGIHFPFIIASPQCPVSPKSWNSPEEQKLLLALLDHLTNSFKVDTDRVYLTGLSMGGYGSWRLAADHPDLFAAVVPVCGGGNPADADRLKNLPIWAWHGEADPTVPVKRSIEMVDAIKKAGSTTVRLTTLAHIGHVSWQSAYASPEVWQWLNEQSAAKNRERAKQQ
jgi:predicted peptidase